MRSNYKPIGDYIQLVDERNKGLGVKQLLGLSISKQFIPSVANIIGTDMENYKIIRKNQFACSTMQVRRDKKMPIALLQDVDEAIISQAYPIFEVKDGKELLPEYLMMWFTRSEFDREACFHAVGGVRGSLEWEDFCSMKFPLPSVEKQREIVAEYNTVANRIELNNQLIQKLEETAQAIYKQWFVEFEFPDENGKPYRSSGGAMVFNEELEKEIPEGWEISTVYDTCKFINGAAFKDEDFSIQNEGLPIVKIAELKAGITEQTAFTTKQMDSRCVISNGDLLYSWSGNPFTSLEVFKWFRGTAILNQHIFKLEFKINQSKSFVFNLLRFLKPIFIKLAEGKQTTGLGHITVADLKDLKIAYPIVCVLKNYNRTNRPLYDLHSYTIVEQIKLYEMKSLLLSKLATI